MSNITQIAPADPQRQARAEFIAAQLEADGRSVRYVAGNIGINHTSLGDRLKGRVAFTVEDIEAIARVLKRDPVRFFAEYIAANPHGPKGEKLPEVDSNHQPAGFTLRLVDAHDSASDAPLKPERHADVIPFPMTHPSRLRKSQ